MNITQMENLIQSTMELYNTVHKMIKFNFARMLEIIYIILLIFFFTLPL